MTTVRESCDICGQQFSAELLTTCHEPSCPHRIGFPESMQTSSDGSTAHYYELPPGATELKHLIWFKNMNAQVGEIFRATYRLGDDHHSDRIRDLNKIIAYAEQEKERIALYEST